MNEEALLAALPKILASNDASVLTGSGPDDCAHVLCDSRRLAISTDAFAEGSHFLPDTSPTDLARKALGASVSDLAASACRPRWALVCLCVRKGLNAEWPGEFARGLAETAAAYGVSVVGGDTVSAKAATFVAVTVIGEPLPGGPVLRSGGRPGDVLVVTGALGGSLLGRHLRPVPRLAEIGLLMAFCTDHPRAEGPAYPTALMDLSDGISLDLARMCRESNVGAVVDADAVPVAEAARQMAAQSGRPALDHALSDGEDFELLIAMPPAVWDAFRAHLDSPEGREASRDMAGFTRIGVMTEAPDLRLRLADGTLAPLVAQGFEHQW